MSEVLSGNEWLILWDHLISLQKPALLLMCVVAYSVHSRESIISLIKSSRDVAGFYTSQGHARAKDLLRIARRLDQEIPERTHPDRYLRNKVLQLNSTGPYFLFISGEYPKFLTESTGRMDLEKLKVQAQSQEHDRKIAESAERKRLHQETQALARQIHKTRLDEVQKFFQERSITNLDWKLEKLLSDAERKRFYCQHSCEEPLEMIRECNKRKSKILDFECIKPSNYEKLQQDVTKLEYEVQNFLDSLRSP
ncbi:WD repeat-containing protein [Ooceraea biroi]|nr:WD repeat-containing protein [Ooceraea biroi]